MREIHRFPFDDVIMNKNMIVIIMDVTGSGSGSGSMIGSPRKSIAPMGGYRSAALWGAAQAWLESGDSIRCDARLW